MENHRFLTYSDGKPFFWLGDTGWLLFSKLNCEEAEKYLENRAEKGFNVIQAMVLHELKVTNVVVIRRFQMLMFRNWQ